MPETGEDGVMRTRWLGWLPVLQREERRNLFETFQGSATWNVDFVVMMGLSTALCALSTASSACPSEIWAIARLLTTDV